MVIFAKSFIKIARTQLRAMRNFETANRYCSSSTRTEYQTDKSLILSDKCIQKLRSVAKDGHFLRIGVDGGGCSGFQYKFELDTKINDDDKVFEQGDVKVVVDEISLQYIKGSTLDYHEELIRSAFRIINNPLAAQGCSCGASFNIKI
ncbi:iron-sulfur cluster assembly 2 homolog, mitochondrial-like [Centruroides sculpturatus]|uniref:iron-sulfur cluster assembly 2 homolog, mitochondrial-like n=1 Tax=Centruroides sculpturatus TaxID=218467 RepID=UPI000C6E271C|nr:iron-sulfur cluster assembly 2 homolog, mitochondrial-like [Centruroides sculpturatus]